MSQFSELLIKIALRIPKGRVTTYGRLAHAAGGGGQAARSVSGILGKSSKKDQIPFHRIVYAGGRVWQCDQYDAARKKLYQQEDIIVNEKGHIENFTDIVWPDL